MKFLNIILLFLLLTACDRNKKFDKTLWTNRSDIGTHPFRNSMYKDLLTNYKLKGISYKQLVNLIGEPGKDFSGEPNEIYYEILTDYGFDIDPVKSKTLIFKFDSDSIIVDFELKEWKK